MKGELLLGLAQTAVETYVRCGRAPEPPGELPDWLQRPAAAFVTLRKEGSLRGCIGTLRATQASLAQEVIQAGVGACARDPRFEPVESAELSQLTYSVYVLGELEPVGGPEELDPQRWGVVVRSGTRSGCLLPGIPGIESAQRQVQLACRKAGIAPDQPVTLHRFPVEKYGEGD